MGKIFFCADLHINHTNVIKYCSRPYSSVEEMNEDIVRIWNNTVSDNDIVYCLGDFAFNINVTEKYLPRLNGKKFLVPGNHCPVFPNKHGAKQEKTNKAIERYEKAGFNVLNLIENITISKPRDGFLGWLGFKKKYKVQLCHFPFAPNGKPGSLDKQDRRYLNQRPKDIGQILLHGHSHCYYRKNGRQIDVGFDGDLKIWSEREIIALIEDKRDYIPSPITEFYKTRNEERELK